MSADNGYHIVKVSEDGFDVYLYFASNNYESYKDMSFQDSFLNLEDAIKWANDQHSEYGISFEDATISIGLYDEYYNFILDGKAVPKQKRILYRILADLTDRRGLRQEFESIDSGIKEEILQTWLQIIKDETINITKGE